jgi:hypothetical protein
MALVALLAIAAPGQSQELRLQSLERKVRAAAGQESRAGHRSLTRSKFCCAQISLTTPVAKVTDAIKLKNTGSKAADSMVLCYLAAKAAGLSFLKVRPSAPPCTPIAMQPSAAQPHAPADR